MATVHDNLFYFILLVQNYISFKRVNIYPPVFKIHDVI